MVRNYKLKNNKKYSCEELNSAINRVINDGLTIAESHREFPSIPYNTIRSHVNGTATTFTLGRRTAFDFFQEESICNALLTLADAGLPADNNQLKRIVSGFCVEIGRPDIFVNRVPTIDWIEGFRKRWKHQLTKM